MRIKFLIGAALIGALILGAIVSGYSFAQTSPNGQFSEKQEDEIRVIVREYLLDNPEVIIEAVNVYAQREREAEIAQAETAAKANISTLLDEKNGFVTGAKPANAKVAVVEFFDYHCGFCKTAAGLVQEMTRNDPEVKVVFRDFPILKPESVYAAEIALAARKQGKYGKLHFALMNTQGTLTKERIRSIAKSNGLDFAALEKARTDPSIPTTINETHRIASEMGVDGTPAFIVAAVDGSYLKVITGNRQPDLLAAIEEAKGSYDAD